MKALVCHGPKDLRITELEAPAPGPGEVLVHVGAGGPEYVARLTEEKIDTVLLKHLQRGVVDRIQLVARQQLDGRVGVDQRLERRLLERCAR